MENIFGDKILSDDYKKYSYFCYKILNQNDLEFYLTKLSIANRLKILKISNEMTLEIIHSTTRKRIKKAMVLITRKIKHRN